MTAYTKPYLPIVDQLVLLDGRGLTIRDEVRAAACLERIGYYRLSAYWYSFRKRIPDGKGGSDAADEFLPGSDFEQAVNLYVFDKKLRMLLLDAIERVEVALRVDIALEIGKHHPLAHRMPAHLDGVFAKRIQQPKGTTLHTDWLERLDYYTKRSKEDFVKRFQAKYCSPLPVWMAIELWDFGMLSRFLEGMKYSDKTAISNKYGLADPTIFASWVRSINFVRNVCAHHNRLWNRVLIDQPKMPKKGEIPQLDHVIKDSNILTKVYAVAAILRHMMKIINPSSSWAQRLSDHMETLPSAPAINEGQTGFPQDWRGLELWLKEKGKEPQSVGGDAET